MKLIPTAAPVASLAKIRDHAPTGWRSTVIAATVLGPALLFALQCGKAPITPEMPAHIPAQRLLHLPSSTTWPAVLYPAAHRSPSHPEGARAKYES